MQSIITAGRVPRVVGTHACILHDDAGTIRHVHRVTTFAGAERREPAGIEREAIRLAARHGRPVEALRVLHLVDFDFDPAKVYKVDIRGRTLVPVGETSQLEQDAGRRRIPS